MGFFQHHAVAFADNAAGVLTTDTVDYDFLFLCEGAFTIPNLRYSFNKHLPVKDAVTSVWGMTGNLAQGGGCDLWSADCSGDLSVGTWTVGTYDTLAEVFAYIAHKSGSEPWQWFSESGGVHLKVRVSDFETPEAGDTNQRNKRINFKLTEERNSTADNSNETYLTRLGL